MNEESESDPGAPTGSTGGVDVGGDPNAGEGPAEPAPIAPGEAEPAGGSNEGGEATGEPNPPVSDPPPVDDPNGQPPVDDPNAPPVMDPPVDDPNAPPVMEPPVVDPPVDDPNTEPPVMEPPVMEPPVMEPPVVDPPVVDPPVVDPPPLLPDCGGFLLCDDFEGGGAGDSPNAAIWQLMRNYAEVDQAPEVELSTEQAHTGNQSVRVSGSAGRSGIIATVPTNNYYMRAWMFAETAPQGPVLAGFGTNANDEVRFRLWSNSWATINSTVGDDLVPQAARGGNCPDCPVVPASDWFCMEYLVDQDGRSATLWIDGVEAAVLDQSWADQPDTPAMFLGSMTLGGGQANVFIDDVLVGTDRIGCD